MPTYRKHVKRALDIFFALAGLATLSPVMVVLAVVCAAAGGGRGLFFQTRAGRDGEPFTMVKFRTMRDLRDHSGCLLPDNERTPCFGRWLRSTSLDELPQMWNVLRGQMSFVGPRPLPVDYLPLYSPFQSRRHLVRPGITGLAQIGGRNDISWDERLALDVWYVDNVSLRLDGKIAALTIWRVLQRKGVDHPPVPPHKSWKK